MAAISVTAGNVIPGADARTLWGVAGETITAGQSLYIASATGLLMKADDTTAAKAACVGIALVGASLNQPCQYQTKGLITIGAAVIVATTYVVGDSAGSISPDTDVATTGEFKTIIGVATTTGIINVNILASGVAVPA
jgi:hypothetical protein